MVKREIFALGSVAAASAFAPATSAKHFNQPAKIGRGRASGVTSLNVTSTLNFSLPLLVHVVHLGAARASLVLPMPIQVAASPMNTVHVIWVCASAQATPEGVNFDQNTIIS